jgi:hypothetical protein
MNMKMDMDSGQWTMDTGQWTRNNGHGTMDMEHRNGAVDMGHRTFFGHGHRHSKILLLGIGKKFKFDL